MNTINPFRVFSVVAMCLFVALMLTQSGCTKHESEKQESVRYLVTSPIMKDTLVYKDYVCQIQSKNHIEIRSQERGYLQNIYVDEGQFVKKGELLFQIMPAIYQADMEKAKASVSYAEIEYLNTKNLADSNIVSKNELALAKARLDKEKAELSLAKAHLEFTQIRAPFDGYIDRFHKRLGSLVDEGELLTSLSDNSNLWGYYNVPESEYLDYSTHAHNQPMVKLRMANNQMFEYEGKVETIEADFNNETGNIAFRATFPNPKKTLRHGETGTILMPVYMKQAILIPQEATFDVLDKKFVFVVDDKGLVTSRQIVVGTEMSHVYAVTSGLNTNDKILIEGLRKVKNNDRIETKYVPYYDVLTDLTHLHAE